MSNTTITKTELEKMLNILNIEVLDAINRSIIYEKPYGWGCKPLLNYAPEALTKFGAAVYLYVVEPLATEDLSDEYAQQYVMQWLSQYPLAEDSIWQSCLDFAPRLLKISQTPIAKELPPNYIDDSPNVYDEIAGYFNGEFYGLYPQFTDFLYSTLSPIRRLKLSDHRIIDLVQETDELLAPHNKALESFIRKEIKRLRSLVNGRIRYEKLTPADIIMLKSSSNRLAVEDAKVVEQALSTRYISGADLKQVNRCLDELRKPAPLTPVPKPLMPAEDYINFFLQELGLAYARFNAKRAEHYSTSTVDPLDDILAGVYAIEHAKARGIDLSNLADIEQNQKQAEKFYLDFNNLKPILMACIQIDLNTLSIDKVFTPETQSHSVIQAMLDFTAKYRAYFTCRYKLFNYDRLVEELHHELHTHTKGFTNAMPPPIVEPLTTEAVANTPKAPRLTSSLAPPYFDITVPIAKVLGDIAADTATTSTEVLLEVPAQDLLVPVQDGMIKRLSHYLIGNEQAVPYLLNGELIVHNTEAGEYIKIIPTLREDGYSDYVFNAYGYTTLIRRIIKLQKLLKESDYYPTYELYGDLQARQKAIADLVDWDKTLVSRVNELYGDEDATSTRVQAELRKILGIHYYKDIYISAHKLAAYTFYPAEYTAFISAKPTDPETGEPLVYHVHHKDDNRSNNSPENLEIISKQLNDELRSTSRPVFYQGKHYNTLKSYCEATEAGNYKNIQQVLNNLDLGDTVAYNGRTYNLDPETDIITATDATATPVITYNDATYTTLKDFADVHNIDYSTVRKGLYRARKAGKTEYKYKSFNFYLGETDNINIKST